MSVVSSLYRGIFLLVILFVLFTSAGYGHAASTGTLIGTWGYTLIGHGTPEGNGFFTWKTEAGTILFRSNGTMTVSYAESADVCPDTYYCLPQETYTVPYRATANPDGSITVIMNPGADQDVMKFIPSDDGSMIVGDGAAVDTVERLLIVAVKLNTSHTYTRADVNGDYYTTGYEHDATGGEKGYFRLQSNISTMNGSGGLVFNGAWNCDGNQINVGPVNGTYDISSTGKILLNGDITGYASSNGKVAIFSNPSLSGGVTDDWNGLVALKKADKTYSTGDLAGTWAVVTFGDDNGTSFYSETGIATCNVSGACTLTLRQKGTDDTVTYRGVSASLSLASDGSCNGFFLTDAAPHVSGAMGNNGNTILIMNTNGNRRNMAVLLKCSSCTSPDGASLKTVRITKSGTGTGRVTSSPAGIDCGETCSAVFPGTSSVTLTGAADAGSYFTGWSSPCSDNSPCTFTPASDINITAAFNPEGFPFLDVIPASWAESYINAIYDAAITSGYGGGNVFKPVYQVTREQMAAFIIRGKEGEPESTYCVSGISLEDISADSWACPYIKRLAELGITAGYGGTNQYKPALTVTREQMAAFIVRALEGEPEACVIPPFVDVPVTSWACPYIKRLAELGITTGYGGSSEYKPALTVTREQMAAFISRAFLTVPE